MRRISFIIIFFIILLAVALRLTACGMQLELTNATPVATWTAVAPTVNGIADVTVWLYDLERQPVDLLVTWSVDGVDQGEITLAAGGHGLSGLTTDATQLGPEGRPEPDGQPHLLRWALPDTVGPDARLRLNFTVDDLESEVGTPVSTPEPGFTRSDGLQAVSRLVSL